MFRIHSLASGEDTFDWNGMDSVGHQVEFREIEFEHVITHFIMHWNPALSPTIHHRRKGNLTKRSLSFPHRQTLVLLMKDFGAQIW